MKLPTLKEILENKTCEKLVSLMGLIFPFLEVLSLLNLLTFQLFSQI